MADSLGRERIVMRLDTTTPREAMLWSGLAYERDISHIEVGPLLAIAGRFGWAGGADMAKLYGHQWTADASWKVGAREAVEEVSRIVDTDPLPTAVVVNALIGSESMRKVREVVGPIKLLASIAPDTARSFTSRVVPPPSDEVLIQRTLEGAVDGVVCTNGQLTGTRKLTAARHMDTMVRGAIPGAYGLGGVFAAIANGASSVEVSTLHLRSDPSARRAVTTLLGEVSRAVEARRWALGVGGTLPQQRPRTIEDM